MLLASIYKYTYTVLININAKYASYRVFTFYSPGVGHRKDSLHSEASLTLLALRLCILLGESTLSLGQLFLGRELEGKGCMFSRHLQACHVASVKSV